MRGWIGIRDHLAGRVGAMPAQVDELHRGQLLRKHVRPVPGGSTRDRMRLQTLAVCWSCGEVFRRRSEHASEITIGVAAKAARKA